MTACARAAVRSRPSRRRAAIPGFPPSTAPSSESSGSLPARYPGRPARPGDAIKSLSRRRSSVRTPRQRTPSGTRSDRTGSGCCHLACRFAVCIRTRRPSQPGWPRWLPATRRGNGMRASPSVSVLSVESTGDHIRLAVPMPGICLPPRLRRRPIRSTPGSHRAVPRPRAPSPGQVCTVAPPGGSGPFAGPARRARRGGAAATVQGPRACAPARRPPARTPGRREPAPRPPARPCLRAAPLRRAPARARRPAGRAGS